MLITNWLIYNEKNNVKSKACWSGGWVSARVSESVSAWVSDVNQWVTVTASDGTDDIMINRLMCCL